MKVVNRLLECDDGRQRPLSLARRNRIVIHRCSLGATAEEISRSFQRDAAARSVTGGQMPYTFVVRQDGVIEQALALSDFGPHALSWSDDGIGVACVGDYRKEVPSPDQWASVVSLCTSLSIYLGEARIYGHGELPGGSRRATIKCPGPFFGLARLRKDVSKALDERAEEALLSAGVVF